VHGACRDLLRYVEATVAVELNAATDNPLVLVDEGLIVSAGNFHGQPLAFALDTLAMAAAELASISERRVERRVNPSLSEGLPPFLV
jgi:histidine ammonia-lyase